MSEGTGQSAEATPRGTSVHEAAEGLFNDLAADPEFAETEESEQPTEEVIEDGDDLDIGDELEGDDLDEDDGEEWDDDESEVGEEAEESGETLYEVTLPGGEKTEVTLEELRSGYSRTEDYTRKRQADAEEHRQAMSAVSEVREQYDAVLAKAMEWLQAQGPAAPNPALRHTDPGEYAAQMAEYEAFQREMGNIAAVRDTIDGERQQEFQAQRYELLQREWDSLMAAVPEWNDEGTRTKELGQLRSHAIENLGFSAEEIDSVADHRLLLMLKQNYELTQAASGAKKVVETKKAKASKRLQPGSSTKTGRNARSKKSRRRQTEADQLAAQTGSVRDAARAIELALAMEEG